MIREGTENYSSAFERNYERWDNLHDKSAFGSELSKAAAKCKTHGEAADQLAAWLDKRVTFLNDYWHK